MTSIERDMLQDNLDRLTRASKINILIAESFRRAEEIGSEMNPLWKEALLYTQSLSRLSVFWAHTELMNAGNGEYRRLAQGVMNKQQAYFRHEILFSDLVADQQLRSETERFVSNVQAGYYAKRH